MKFKVIAKQVLKAWDDFDNDDWDDEDKDEEPEFPWWLPHVDIEDPSRDIYFHISYSREGLYLEYEEDGGTSVLAYIDDKLAYRIIRFLNNETLDTLRIGDFQLKSVTLGILTLEYPKSNIAIVLDKAKIKEIVKCLDEILEYQEGN